MSLSTLNISPILREMGERGWDREMIVNGHPLMTQIETKTDAMVGDYFKIPVQYAKPAGRSHSSTVAYDNEAGSKQSAFEVTPVSDFLIFRIQGPVVRKAKQSNNENSFVDAVEQEVKLALEGEGDNVAKEAYGSRGGARARVHPTTAISTTSLTLANPADAVFFYPNMYVCASDTDGTSGSLRDSGDRIQVASVNLSTGVLTGAANWSGISGITNNDYLFAEGDFGVATAGLESWNPASAPGATAFYTVDRSVAPDFLGGMRYDGADDSVESVLIKADRLFRLQQGNPFKKYEIYMNPMTAGGLRLSKEGQRFIDEDNEYKIGVEKFRTANGHIIVEDRDCPVGIARAIGTGCFMHMTTGDQPALADVDGVEMVYDNRTDTYTASVVIDHNFGSRSPQGLGRITMPTGASS
jgi:hypothetical protein